VYALLYTAWRSLNLPRLNLQLPTNTAIATYAILLGLVTALVRTVFPIDPWVYVFGVLPMEVAHLPQYASLFFLGLAAARGQWFERFPTQAGLAWLAVGLGLAALRYTMGVPSSAVWSMWDSMLCTSLCIGLIVLCREARLNLRWAAPLAYDAYLIHVVPVVVGLRFVLINVDMSPLAKFAIVAGLGVPLSFAAAAALRFVPGAKHVL
jgi:hypothetical protein